MWAHAPRISWCAMPYFQKVLNADGTVSPTRYLAGNPSLLADIGGISGTASVANQGYDGLQIAVQKRFSAGLQYSVAYTYSKCMTNADWLFRTEPVRPMAHRPSIRTFTTQPPTGDHANITPLTTLSRTRCMISPSAAERSLGRNLNKAVDAIVGGWQASGILSLHSGFPVTVTASDASGTLAGAARANCLFPATVYGEQNAPQGGYLWFNPSAYAQPAAGTFGSCGNGTLRGPGLASLDFNLQKSFRIGE